MSDAPRKRWVLRRCCRSAACNCSTSAATSSPNTPRRSRPSTVARHARVEAASACNGRVQRGQKRGCSGSCSSAAIDVRRVCVLAGDLAERSAAEMTGDVFGMKGLGGQLCVDAGKLEVEGKGGIVPVSGRRSGRACPQSRRP
eukprot:3937064-Rhodomonas_salina.5